MTVYGRKMIRQVFEASQGYAGKVTDGWALHAEKDRPTGKQERFVSG
jgi:hypothetical protein